MEDLGGASCSMRHLEHHRPADRPDMPMWAHMGTQGPSWTGLGEGVNFPSTFRRDIWTNFARFGSKTKLLKNVLDDSAWFCVEKLKKPNKDTKRPNNVINKLKKKLT